MLIAFLCIMLIAAGVALSFFSAVYGTALAFLALCTTGLLPGVELPVSTYLFWGTAMVIVVALYFILPRIIAQSRRGLPYIAGASLAGAVIGMAIGSHAAVILGAVVGALLGGVAYGRTPAGRMLQFPSQKFFNYLCAKGLPVAIAMSMAALSATLLLAVWPV
ncbi:MAG: hypothetical protein NC339_05215 [Muribaculaceae bacterium]|nr:hypothetical protein [Muribaculaceae bacterium]